MDACHVSPRLILIEAERNSRVTDRADGMGGMDVVSLDAVI
jgi:hypothetical protein